MFSGSVKRILIAASGNFHSSYVIENCNDRIFIYRALSCLRLKNTIFNVESLVQQSVNATSSPSVTRKQLLLVLNCNSHLSCPFV